MSGNQPIDNALVEKLLRERDELYRRASLAESKLAELSDADALKKSYESKLAGKDAELKKKDAVIKKKENKIIKLVRELEWLRRKMWGKMGEKRQIPENPNQLKLDFGEGKLTAEEIKAAEDAEKKITDDRKARKVRIKSYEKTVPVRKHLPKDLRHEEEHLYPEGYLGHENEWILFEDTEKSEHLVTTAPDVYVLVTIRHKGKRKATGEIKTAKCPLWPLERSYASASLLADLTVGKYYYHIPFYRQIQMFKQAGVELPQSTVELWFKGAADLMLPLYYRIKDLILAEDYVESDETTIPIVNNEKKRTVKGYLWLARAILKPLVFFHYHEGSRAGYIALEFFSHYKGAIQVDGYSGYNILDKLDGIIILCCWAHARRYFDRAINNDKERAEYALSLISMLYSVETMADERELDYDGRKALREELSYPIIKALEAWALTEYEKVLPKSPIGKALNYLLVHIRQLSRYTTDGRYRIDNNLVENTVRPVAVGRKGYLFCGDHNAAENAAVMYTMMGCCRLADVDPRKWAIYFFDHVHEYDNDYSKDIAELLPHRLKEAGLI